MRSIDQVAGPLPPRRFSALTGAGAWLRRSPDARFALFGACLAGGLAVLALQVWRADFNVPFRYTGDANFNAMLIKGTLEHGWWFTNPSLGAPFGQQLYDFPAGSVNLDLGLIRLLGFVLPNSVVVMNVFFLLTFPLAALSAYAVLRWSRLSAPAACACAVLYALAPYHFRRGEGHLFLAADFAVPLGAYLVLGVAAGRRMFAPAPKPGRSLCSRRTLLLTVAAVAIVASAGDGFYYAAFTIVLVVAMTVLRVAVARSLKAAATGAAVTALLLGACVANLAPTLAYAMAHGQNDVAAVRQPAESETYSLKLAQLLLPRDNHRIGALASLKNRYATTTQPRAPSEVYDASLGTVGDVGFVWLLLVLAATTLAGRRRLPRIVRDSRPAALAAATALLVGSTGGLSALFAYLVTPQLRAWNRISIFIAFFSLLAVGLLLDRARQALRKRRRRHALFIALLATVVGIGYADQTSSADVPNYSSLTTRYQADGAFVRTIESILPPGASVFELPYQAFPEGSKIGGTDRYDPIRPYLHSTRLRWSYGAMVGRPEDWQASLVGRSLSETTAGVAAAGFSGLYVDLAGYGPSRERVKRTLRALLDERPLESSNGRLLFFDIRRYGASLKAVHGARTIEKLRAATLTPPRVESAGNVGSVRFGAVTGGQTWSAQGPKAAVELYEPSHPEWVIFQTNVSLPADAGREGPVYLAITWPDGSTLNLRVGSSSVNIQRRLYLRRGDNRTQFHLREVGAATRAARLHFWGARFGLGAFAPFAPPREPLSRRV